MTIEPRAIELEKPFSASREKFEALLTQLGGDHALASDHAALERRLKTEGFEVLRQLLQDHLLLRSVREVALPSVTGKDGIVRTWRRETDRPLETIFGPVTVYRLAYGAEGISSLRPMEAELNLPVETFSLGVRRHVAESVADGAYEAAVASVLANTAARIAKRQAELLAVRAAADFDAFYQQRTGTVHLGSPESILVITVDGKGVVMRPGGLREETRKAAEKKVPKLKHRHYDRYLAAGLPIASGAIEGACRHLVMDRMDITGARWGLPGAEAVLRLRALRASGDFDEYWTFHEAQEAARGHAALFAVPIMHTETAPARALAS